MLLPCCSSACNPQPCPAVLTSSKVAGTSRKTIALVGKGLTFDSGGYNLKVGGMIEMMKFDMGGGGAVLGAAQIIAALKPPGVTVSSAACARCCSPGMPCWCAVGQSFGWCRAGSRIPCMLPGLHTSHAGLPADTLHLSFLREHDRRQGHAAWRHPDQCQRQDR